MVGSQLNLHLGSGRIRIDGFTNVDIAPLPEVDVVHDLDVAPWPFADESVQEIRAFDIFEHVNNPITFMTEGHRVLVPGGSFLIRTTHWKSESAFTDPTHKRFCTPYTFDYWVPGTIYHEHHNAAYGGVDFIKEKLGPSGLEMLVLLRKPDG